jgi:hypothetical protein
MSTAVEQPTDLVIWNRIVEPGNPNMDPEAARGILRLTFSREDSARVQSLQDKANEGELTPQERAELDS